MKRLIFAAFWLAAPVGAHHVDPVCPDSGCRALVRFASLSPERAYGLLIAAAPGACDHVRFRVEDEGARFLGHTPPLEVGELAVVRMGRGFPVGEVRLSVLPVGCETRPMTLRRVTLSKQSPDHGWRAGGVTAP